MLGLYDKGKTFVLNQLTESKLPSGKKSATTLSVPPSCNLRIDTL